MTRVVKSAAHGAIWTLPFLLVAIYVALRMGAGGLWTEVDTGPRALYVPNTFATVDHPFHVARADILWRQLASGAVPRWIGQHQGGYPVEFYPLGEAWLEVAVRALSLGALPAEGAHTLAVIVLFLAPGVAFAALVAEDGWPAVVALLALCLHVAFPGGWYHGGYTELVQWALVTNVASAVAAFAMFPVLLQFVRGGPGWTGGLAGALGAAAIYCNPRSLLGLLALGCGVAVATLVAGCPNAASGVARRLLVVAVVGGLLAAPELMSLARFGDLYAFVHYSGYDRPADYLAASIDAVSWPVATLAAMGVALGLALPRHPALKAASSSLVIYVLGTLAVSFVPAVARIAPQLEPTRLMPLQRLLMLYLAAAALWSIVRWIMARVSIAPDWAATALIALAAIAILLGQTRPLPGPPPDPASPAIPPVSLYAVEMSGQPQQADLAAAVRAADSAAAPGTALLVLGSALSWHQQLWAPLWTERPLTYDNWLWFWSPLHAGTPGYAFQAGHHYPDPEMTLRPDFLRWHGIGAVVVTGAARATAAASPDLQPLLGGMYDAYVVREATTVVSAPDRAELAVAYQNETITAQVAPAATTFLVRVNWFPRWSATVDDREAAIVRRADGYMDVRGQQPGNLLRLAYEVQPLDWLARGLAVTGLLLAFWLARTWSGVGAEP
jgi:hypothetical protein